MDYIYSYLNDDVASREMHGSETNTAVVTVNAATNTISVDVKPISPSMLNVAKPTESGNYILQETISITGEVSYSWATLEDYNQGVTQAIANLTQQLEQEKQERIESVQAEANTRELADTQLRTEFTSEIAQEKQEREQAVSEEAQRTNSMINQLNDNVQEGFNTINNVLTTSINNINNAILNESTVREEQYQDTEFRIRDLNTRLGVEIDNRESWDAEIYANLSADIANEKRERVEQDQDIRNSIGAESNERKSVDQHLWDILPDNIVAGTPMQGMENANAVNIVFSKYQKHGIGEDPADAELVEVPNQAITLFPATQEVAGVLTAADKTKIDNIATDIETAVEAEANAREEADNALSERITAIEDTNVLQSQILGDGSIQMTINSPAGRTFDVDVVDISDASNDNRFTLTLNNNDSISGKLNSSEDSVPLVFVSKGNKVEVGGSGAPLNLNSDDGTVTVNDTYTLLNNTDKDKLNGAIEAETNRATQAEIDLDEKINTTKNDILGDVAESYNTLGKLEDAIQDEITARETADTALQENIDNEITRATQAETNLQEAIDAEKNRAEATETNINASISSVIQKATHNVVDGVSVNIINGNSASLDYTTYNTGIGDDGEPSSTPIPMANATSAGLMSNAHVADLNNSLKLTGKTLQTIQGDVTVQGNLVINGTTTTEDTETLMVQDNIIVTNSDGVELETALSGVGIRTNATSTFGIVYVPNVSELQAGIGSLDANNSFSFADNEGNPIALRDSDTELTDGNILAWTNAGHKLIDGNIPAKQIARIDQAQTFSGVQTFANVVATNTSTTSFTLNGVALQSNVAGNIAVESQLSSAIKNLVNGANTGYQTLGEIEACIVSVNDDLHGYKTSTNSNIAQIEGNINKINANTSTMNTSISSAQSCAADAYTQANNAYTQANTAYSRADEAYDLASVTNTLANSANTVATTANNAITTHAADTNNPHKVSKEDVGLSNVDNVKQYSASNPPPYGTLTFTGAVEDSFTASTSKTIEIPTVPTLHSVSISTNNGSATTVVGNVYSNSATPIEIPIPESQTITLSNTYNVNSGANGIVTGISLENGVLTVSYGALDDGTLDDGAL